MQWLSDLPFADNRVLQIGFLAACGIAALVVLAIVYRLVFAHRLRVPGGRTRQPRLGLVDAFSLDGQRQLVLIRRDNVEHLVMIGGPNDVLIEPQINRAMTPAREKISLPLSSLRARRRGEPNLVSSPQPVVAEALRRRQPLLRPPLRRPQPRLRPPLRRPPPPPRPRARPPPPAQQPRLRSRRQADRGEPGAPHPLRPTCSAARCAIGGDRSTDACKSAAATSRAAAPGNAAADCSGDWIDFQGAGRASARKGSCAERLARARPGNPKPAPRARSASALGKGGFGGRSGESGTARNAADAPSRRRARPSPKAAAGRKDATVAAGGQRAAAVRGWSPGGAESECAVKRQGADESRRSVRRARIARGGNGAPARPRKAKLTEAPSVAGVMLRCARVLAQLGRTRFAADAWPAERADGEADRAAHRLVEIGQALVEIDVPAPLAAHERPSPEERVAEDMRPNRRGN